MKKRIVSIISILAIVGLLSVIATALDQRSDTEKVNRLQANVEQTKVKVQLPEGRRLKALEEDAKVLAIKKKQALALAAAQADTFYVEDFETDNGWQATSSWGQRVGPVVGGLLDEDHSDWELVTDNSNSPVTSWHETGATMIQTDMLLSPPITLPTEVTVGGVTSVLKAVNMCVSLDWDNIDAAEQFRVYAGKTESLWTLDASDPSPGSGGNAWVLEVPTAGKYVEFIRQFLTTGEIDLTSATAPVTLSFYVKSISETEFDYNKVDVSTDNFKSFLTVFSHADGPASGGGAGIAAWTLITANLDAFIGSSIRIRFSQNGDFGFVEPGNIYAVDDVSVDDAVGNLFLDDGGDTATALTASGFVPGNQVLILGGPGANPTPNWSTIDLTQFGVNILDGGDGDVEPGDEIQIGIVFIAGANPPGRGFISTILN